MDPLSLVAHVAGIAGFTDTVVTSTYKYITEARNADQSIRRFFAEGQSFLWVLTGIQHTLKLMSEDNFHIQTNVGKQLDVCLKLVKEIRDILVDPELHKSSIGKFKRASEMAVRYDENGGAYEIPRETKDNAQSSF
jgi:hypothetical protein